MIAVLTLSCDFRRNSSFYVSALLDTATSYGAMALSTPYVDYILRVVGRKACNRLLLPSRFDTDVSSSAINILVPRWHCLAFAVALSPSACLRKSSMQTVAKFVLPRNPVVTVKLHLIPNTGLNAVCVSRCIGQYT